MNPPPVPPRETPEPGYCAGGAGRDLLSLLADRQPELVQHMLEVAELAAAVAERLGLPADAVEETRLAAELRDIGKLLIDDEIQDRAGPLNQREWRTIRHHTRTGERIILAPVRRPHRGCTRRGRPRT